MQVYRITKKVVSQCSWNFWECRPSDKEHLVRFRDWSRSRSTSRSSINFSTFPKL